MLLNRSLPSIRQQTKPPDALVVVFDKRSPTNQELQLLQAAAGATPLVVLHNDQPQGAAGAWNTGLDWIYQHRPASYVAILDDDDTWDANHLETCWRTAEQAQWPDIILSGLRRSIQGAIAKEALPESPTPDGFLVGNPGWQGSNTFVSAKALAKVGGFTSGLSSCNDKDLAIRLLSTPDITQAQTGTFTATWYCNERAEALSAPGSASKLDGLAMFMELHQHRMSAKQQARFFERAKRLFQFTQEQIIHRMSALSSMRRVTHGLPQQGPTAGQRDPVSAPPHRTKPDP
ncbi:glycosyltransferase family 2 protein [Ferrimonas balearica]|uniref:glycosyltransferase family 2 protein n=1 Tax=Ferrimonas balearica TaxID=44012 RepID=UPI001C55FE81|nr:glycosyltransferase [Ferrimonas balearica]MBW3164591.1 glycosyltransferase [Ferrimonas balearica]